MTDEPDVAQGAFDALVKAEAAFESIRLILVNHLEEPERSAFWKAVTARDAIRAALAGQPPTASVETPCKLCAGAGFVTYRDGIAYETHDVEKEEHLIEDCPECKGSGVIPDDAQAERVWHRKDCPFCGSPDGQYSASLQDLPAAFFCKGCGINAAQHFASGLANACEQDEGA